MPWLIGTRAQATAARDRLHNRLGLPRVATEAERIGAGPHTPVAQCVTTRWAFVARLSDGRFALRIKPRVLRHLTATQAERVVADLPEGVTLAREDEDL